MIQTPVHIPITQYPAKNSPSGTNYYIIIKYIKYIYHTHDPSLSSHLSIHLYSIHVFIYLRLRARTRWLRRRTKLLGRSWGWPELGSLPRDSFYQVHSCKKPGNLTYMMLVYFFLTLGGFY